eukprot:g41046.t1
MSLGATKERAPLDFLVVLEPQVCLFYILYPVFTLIFFPAAQAHAQQGLPETDTNATVIMLTLKAGLQGERGSPGVAGQKGEQRSRIKLTIPRGRSEAAESHGSLLRRPTSFLWGFIPTEVPGIIDTSLQPMKQLNALDTAKAMGPATIPAIILKTCAPELATALAKLFQYSYNTVIHPVMWQIAQ